MRYLKKFNENFSGQELPQAVKDALEDAISTLSPEDVEALKRQLSGVTEAEIEDAVETAQGQAQAEAPQGEPDADAPTNENWISRNRGSIGALLLLGGLGALGIKGEIASHITDTLKDNQVINVLQDPVWVGAAISTLAGLLGVGSAVHKGMKQSSEEAKLNWERNMIRKGLAKRDSSGTLINTKTGKPAVYNG